LANDTAIQSAGFVAGFRYVGPAYQFYGKLEVATLISARLRTEIAHAGTDAHLESLLQ